MNGENSAELTAPSHNINKEDIEQEITFNINCRTTPFKGGNSNLILGYFYIRFHWTREFINKDSLKTIG